MKKKTPLNVRSAASLGRPPSRHTSPKAGSGEPSEGLQTGAERIVTTLQCSIMHRRRTRAKCNCATVNCPRAKVRHFRGQARPLVNGRTHRVIVSSTNYRDDISRRRHGDESPFFPRKGKTSFIFRKH